MPSRCRVFIARLQSIPSFLALLLKGSPRGVVFTLTLIVSVVCIYEKLHLSSVGVWGAHLKPRAEIPGLIYGTPRAIRSDEWMLGVPWQLSQAATNPGWATHNPSVGPDTAALLVGLPTRHWTAIFRPAHWGFYLLDLERGFSWMWIWRSVVPFSALLILFLELCPGSFACSLAGAIWVFFAAFTQWWLASVAEMLAYFAFACVSLRYLCIGSGLWRVVAASAALLISALGFALCLYPPFQVPLVYLGLALLPFLTQGLLAARGPGIGLRVGLFVGIAVAAFTVLLVFMIDNAAVVALMEQTVYPGRRISLGGDLSLWRYVAGLFERNYTHEVFAPLAGNVCEASTFILLWPLALLMLPFISKRGELLRCIPLVTYLVLTSLWALFGIPESLALASGWSFVPTGRAIIGWGLGGTLLSVVVMHRANRAPTFLRWIYLLSAALLLLWCVGEFPNRFPSGIPLAELQYSAVWIMVAVVALILRLPWGLVAALFVLCVSPHSQVNPVMRGLSVISDVPLLQAIRRFDPNREGRWAVFGSLLHAQLAKTTGRNVVNGSQYAPDLEALKILDPDGAYTDVYNRYAHTVFSVAPAGTPPTFTLLAPDTWELQVDPCNQRFTDFGVRYLVWQNYTSSRSFECYERIFVGKDFAIYKSRQSY